MHISRVGSAFDCERLRPPGEAVLPEALDVALSGCLRRVRSWGPPPRWSATDWMEEARLIATAACWKASCEFDPARGSSSEDFAYDRAVAAVLTRHRKEWAYGRRCACHPDGGEDDDAASVRAGRDFRDVAQPDPTLEAVREAVTLLPLEARRLVQELFWEGLTQAQIGDRLGISQRAVSSRRQKALELVRAVFCG